MASELTPICKKQHIALSISGVDLIPNAVELAKFNAEKNQLNVVFFQSQWFENVEGKFDLIVSNPPYIDEKDKHLSQGDVRFEPLSALVATEQGYGDLRHIIEQTPTYLNEGGALLLEHGWQQGEKCGQFLRKIIGKRLQLCVIMATMSALHTVFGKVMKYNKRALYDQFVSFYHIISDDYEESKISIRGKMGALVRRARCEISPDWSVEDRINRLLQMVYREWGFRCDPNSYFRSRNLYLPYVLEYREGMPVSLGAIILYLAEALDLPIYPVNFPTQLILRAEVDTRVAFIDPWNGSYISLENYSSFMRAHLALGQKFSPKNLSGQIFHFFFLALNSLPKTL
ncbi:prenyltransferase [Rodentibacter pneumotropicus]|uniref:peptide chain release factor N(5)-glutamine methyltransferase n=1 Tax=Rodentibacter pneumotropicus TaxID=758 RepID=A0A3S4W1V6_9PAST|nr:prenyltransferase [Rodentibacter pneumotropicus]